MVSEKVYTWVGRGVTSWDGYYDAMDGFFFHRLCLDTQALLWDMHIVGRRHSLPDVLSLYSNSIV